jgi:Domain of unknown function (DUF1918)
MPIPRADLDGAAKEIPRAQLFTPARSRQRLVSPTTDGVDAMKPMRAQVGDRLVVRRHRVGEPDRTAEILEIKGDDGQPPYVVRWSDGHVSLMFPGSDAFLEHESRAGTS